MQTTYFRKVTNTEEKNAELIFFFTDRFTNGRAIMVKQRNTYHKIKFVFISVGQGDGWNEEGHKTDGEASS